MNIVEILVTLVCSAFASTGLWSFIAMKRNNKDSMRDMLIGLGHDRIIYLGTQYIERGSITQSEYENLIDYLYKPYEALGGNGSAKRIVEECKKLPIHG